MGITSQSIRQVKVFATVKNTSSSPATLHFEYESPKVGTDESYHHLKIEVTTANPDKLDLEAHSAKWDMRTTTFRSATIKTTPKTQDPT